MDADEPVTRLMPDHTVREGSRAGQGGGGCRGPEGQGQTGPILPGRGGGGPAHTLHSPGPGALSFTQVALLASACFPIS